jgi:hypothetical protein
MCLDFLSERTRDLSHGRVLKKTSTQRGEFNPIVCVELKILPASFIRVFVNVLERPAKIIQTWKTLKHARPLSHLFRRKWG